MHTDFAELYDKFIIGKKLNQKQYETLLAIAICFTNADDINVQQWGYRIVVEYCNQTQDYMPLYEIAINKGLYPVSKFIERHYIDDDQRNFFTEWNDAFTEQYISGDICRSEQQDALIKFFEKKYNNTISISAPTSYGKSELILSTIKEYKGRKICVLTSTKALLTQTKKRIQQISKGIFPKVVVHPEMYNSKDVSCLAVLTQERLLRVLKKDPALAFDCIIVDEAHEILENNARSRILADVIIVAQKRNPDVATPYSVDNNNRISIPDNLYIVGTMNTADKSIGGIDYAIRRRFLFFEQLPDIKVIEEYKAEKGSQQLELNAQACKLFENVATLFEENYLSAEYRKEDVQIGHTYFLVDSKDKLMKRFEYQIIPILKEYYKDGIINFEISDETDGFNGFLNCIAGKINMTSQRGDIENIFNDLIE